MRPPNLWQMFEEASTGYSGALGRQVTLNTVTATNPGVQALLTSLQAADERGVVNLRGNGLRAGSAVDLSYDGFAHSYLVGNPAASLTAAPLLAEASQGTTLVTLTANLRSGAGGRQPLLATVPNPSLPTQISDPPLPQLVSGSPPFTVAGTDVSSGAVVFVDGQAAQGATLSWSAGVTNGFCNNGNVSITLAARPSPEGLHLLQVQNPQGLLSDELPICVATVANVGACLTDQ